MSVFSKGEATIELAAEPLTVVAGQTVKVRATVAGQADEKTRGARVELSYVNTYRDREYDQSDDRQETRIRHDEIVVASQALPPGAGSRLAEGVHEVELRIPDHAPPSMDDVIEWRAEGVIDREKARDAVTVVPLTVLSDAAAHQGWANHPPDVELGCPMEFRLDKRIFRVGEPIDGYVVMTPRDEIKANEIRLELKAVQTDSGGEWSRTEKAGEITISDKVKLEPGHPLEFGFTLAVPEGWPASFEARRTTLHWYLEAIVSRRMRSDFNGRVEIVVANA